MVVRSILIISKDSSFAIEPKMSRETSDRWRFRAVVKRKGNRGRGPILRSYPGEDFHTSGHIESRLPEPGIEMVLDDGRKSGPFGAVVQLAYAEVLLSPHFFLYSYGVLDFLPSL
jgi:hypothetical protein